VNARLPLLTRIGEDLLQVIDRKHQLIQQSHSTNLDSDSQKSSTKLTLRGEFRQLEEQLDQLKSEITALGGTLIDLQTTTLEFLGEVDGNLAWFSWQAGEKCIRAWRPVDGEPGERLALPGFVLDNSNQNVPVKDRKIVE
jgi:hypothetical protein